MSDTLWGVRHLGRTSIMRIINLEDKNQLNEFIIRAGGVFLQSWEWGEFQEKIGAKVWRLGIEDNNELVAAATIIKKKLPFGRSYFYSPQGPISHNTYHVTHNIEFLFSEIERIAKGEGVIFFRFEPPAIIHNSLFVIQKTIDVQPNKTLILDLSKSEEELLKAMHEKTRYNIRLAEKKGVKVIEAGVNKFKDFWNLLDQTSGRDKFRPHGRDYYQAMLGVAGDINPPSPLKKGGEGGVIKLFFAQYQGKLIATGIFSFFSDTVTYLHGGSADEHRNVMAPYLLQWQVIKLAKSLEYKYYDFYGIDENKWPGVTRFKRGFGGTEVKYPGTFDLVFGKRWYNIYKLVRGVKRKF